jgi:hypothetical protein
MSRGLTIPRGHRGVADDMLGGRAGNSPGPFESCTFLSFGHGVPSTDDELPNFPEQSSSFWLTPDGDSDHAQVDQVHEWEAGGVAAFASLDVFVYLANIDDTGSPSVCKLIVTVNGVETGILVNVLDGTSGRLQANGAVAIVDGDLVGVKWKTDANFDGGQLRATVKMCASFLQPTPIPPPPVLPGLGLLTMWETDPTVSTLTIGAGPVLTGVTDGTGNGFDLTQATGARQVPWVPGVVNGFGVARFPNTQDKILEYSASNLGLVDGQARTVMAVFKPSSAFGGSLVVFKRATNYMGFELWTSGGAQAFYGNGQFPTPVNCNAVTPVDYGGNQLVVIWDWDGATLRCRVNGVPIPLSTTVLGDETSVAPGVTVGNNNGVFGDRGFIGDWSGSWVWDRSLNATPGDTELAETYAGKYF